ncbi:hypothetical protein T08_8800 [Trichinella sp. T8]|nr:hypothetical protein T08_8800 [Trichinella sp. T8]
MLTLLASRIRRYLSKATILYKIVCNYDEIIKEFLAIFLNTSQYNIFLRETCSFEPCRAKSSDNMDSPLVYLKKYAITDGL